VLGYQRDGSLEFRINRYRLVLGYQRDGSLEFRINRYRLVFGYRQGRNLKSLTNGRIYKHVINSMKHNVCIIFRTKSNKLGKLCEFCADGNCAKSVFLRSATRTNFAIPVPPSG